jgi:hypothetical protein
MRADKTLVVTHLGTRFEADINFEEDCVVVYRTGSSRPVARMPVDGRSLVKLSDATRKVARFIVQAEKDKLKFSQQGIEVCVPI